MPVDPPDDATLRSIAQRYGLGLTDADLTSFRPFVEGLLASWGAVEELYAASRPTMPERAWSRPEPADNPFNAWYVTTSITGSGDGPLAGKTVAVKDNTAVAGVPMMNGAGTMEGYTPLRDATVVVPRPRGGRHRSPARPSARTSASPAARTPRRPGRSATRGTRRARRAARRRAARRS